MLTAFAVSGHSYLDIMVRSAGLLLVLFGCLALLQSHISVLDAHSERSEGFHLPAEGKRLLADRLPLCCAHRSIRLVSVYTGFLASGLETGNSEFSNLGWK
ncbi:hypothetical protein MTO96_027196 [Rhipicephalus appendiculatus]